MAGKGKKAGTAKSPREEPKRRSPRTDAQGADAFRRHEAKIEKSVARKRQKIASRKQSPRRSPRRGGSNTHELPTLRARRTTRSSLPYPYCELFGKDRIQRYSKYLMCHNCDINEATEESQSARKDWSRFSKRNQCTANHKSFVHPTTLKRIPEMMLWRGYHHQSCCFRLAPQINIADDCEDSDDDVNEIDDATMKEAILQQVKEFEERLNKYEEESISLKIQLTQEKSKREEIYQQNVRLHSSSQKLRQQLSNKDDVSAPTAKTNEEMLSEAVGLLFKLTNTSRKKQESQANAIAELLLGEKDLLDGRLAEALTAKMKKDLRSDVFSEARILKKMDEKGFVLNLGGIQAFKEIVTNGERYRRSFIPSPTAIRKCQDVIHAFGDHTIPFKLGHLPEEIGGGEMFRFDQSAMLKIIAKSFGLLEKAKSEKVGINYAYDGTDVSDFNLCLGGFKVSDKDARDPITKRPLYGDASGYGLQSFKTVFPDAGAIMKDGKDGFEKFRPNIESISRESQDIGDPLLGTYMDRHGNDNKFKHISGKFHSDMKTNWMAHGVGCAFKTRGDDTMPCFACSIKNRDIALGTKILCTKWCRENNRDGSWTCYHRDMMTPEFLASQKAQLEQLQVVDAFLQEMDLLKSKCKFNWDRDPAPAMAVPGQLSNPDSIHFDYGLNRDKPEHRVFVSNVANDLIQRGIRPSGTLEERVEVLRGCLTQEFSYLSLQQAIAHDEIGRQNASVLLIDNLPCLLHLENRVGIKIVTCILRAGLQNAIDAKGLIYDQVTSKWQRIKQFLDRANAVFKKKLFGTPQKQCRWNIPYEDDKECIGVLSFGNQRARKAINGIKSLVEVCVPLEDDQVRWVDCIGEYSAAMEIARSKEDLDDQQIHSFQRHVDDFFQEWLKIMKGKEGVTNYIHMLASGHVAEYMFEYRNLYLHSQQGWEAMNSIVKSVYFRRTNRGGGRGDRSRLLGLVRWLQRRMLWLAGYSYDEMEAAVQQNGWTTNVDPL